MDKSSLKDLLDAAVFAAPESSSSSSSGEESHEVPKSVAVEETVIVESVESDDGKGSPDTEEHEESIMTVTENVSDVFA